MRKLIFFIGPAGAGKTTLAKALAKKRGTALLDMDTLLRPAAETIMTITGHDPSDRDSAVYKMYCRDLGYRVTMDAALENVQLGTDIIVIGPFTKETADPAWLEAELARIGASPADVQIRAVAVFLPQEELYRQRIQSRGLEIDEWKLGNWNDFRGSLIAREIKWELPEGSIIHFDNSGELTEEKLAGLEQLIYGTE
jgi:predicted kinase